MEKSNTRGSIDSYSSHEPFLIESNIESTRIPRQRYRQQVLFNIATVVYILITLPLLAMNYLRYPLQPYSPANNIISLEMHRLLFHEFDERFHGTPEDTDPHWEHLLEPTSFSATKKELNQAHAELSDDLVELPDGSNPATLAVYHELHCLDALRRNMNTEFYYQNLTKEQEAFNLYHRKHCIESIRRTLMCKADTSMYASYWIAKEGSWPSKELRSNSGQVCANWEKVDNWVRERMLPKGKYLLKPGPFDRADALGKTE